MLVGTQKILCLVQNSFGNFIDVFRVGMLALSLLAFSLLAKTDTLGFFIYDVLMNCFFATTHNSLLVEVILSVFGEKMLTSNFSDG